MFQRRRESDKLTRMYARLLERSVKYAPGIELVQSGLMTCAFGIHILMDCIAMYVVTAGKS